MNDKINLGEVTPAEYNIIMKQLTAGQLGECIDLFMKFRAIGMTHQKALEGAQDQGVQTLQPPAA